MSYVSLSYYALLIPGVMLLYYLLPMKWRYFALLAGSIVFYCLLIQSPYQLLMLLGSAVLSWVLGIWLEASAVSKRTLYVSIGLVLLPLLLMKCLDYVNAAGVQTPMDSILWPIGLSFYTLQLLAYLVDVYHGKIQAQHQFFPFLLFVTWFPQILQGPIPRFEQLEEQLIQGHSLKENEDSIRHGMLLISWGLFLEFMIADKIAPFVNQIYEDPTPYGGSVLLFAGIGYSIQLYADFLSCTTLAQGVSLLFGIRLADNFHHPYFAISVQDFWHRWHMSLSSWLRDYIYIPLGGNRKGLKRKDLNILITFLVSGFWHGGSGRFLFWGLLHGIYQLIGAWTRNGRDQLCRTLHLEKTVLTQDGKSVQMSPFLRLLKMLVTSILVMLGWIIFRAETLGQGLWMIAHIVLRWDLAFWIPGRQKQVPAWTSLRMLFFDQSDRLQILVAGCSVLFLVLVSLMQELLERQGKKTIIGALDEKPVILQVILWTALVLIILFLGTYGAGYAASDFLYGEF